MNDLATAIRQIPPVTRTVIGAVLGGSVLSLAGVITPVYFVNYWPWTFGKLQLWRLATSFCLAGKGFEMLLNVFFLYRYSNDLESIKFVTSTADYAFYLMFNMTLILVGPIFFQSASL